VTCSAIFVVIVVDIGPELSVTGSNVGTAVKAEHQTMNVENASSHSTERSRPASKWCMYCLSCFNYSCR